MKKEIEIIRYLLDEIEQFEQDMQSYKVCAEANPTEAWRYDKPQKQIVIDNCKKIRQLALKIGKEV